MRRVPLLALLVIATLAVSAPLAGARQATPAIELATPAPADCTVAPRTPEEIEALVATSGDATVAVALETPNTDGATPTPFVAPVGTPVTGGETEDAVTSVVTQFYACRNANDVLRMYALMTDDYLVRTMDAGQIEPASLENVGTPAGGIVESEQVTIAINGIVEIEPDVYGVNVVGVLGVSGQEFTDYLIVVQADGAYLIDDLQNLS